ncbi:MAG: HAMP domain-containing protein, partial [Pseudomonadales bacterium]|nr:HAMP domain-containing protein [Pseudomonadales bacterium]
AQTNSMKNFVLDSGASLAKMIAIESAEPLLSEDWVSVEALIEDLSQNQEFVYLLLLDHTNTVRGKALPNYIVPGDLERLPEDHIVHSEVQVRDWQTVNKSIFDFSTPVTFQNKKIGVLKMGLSQQELQEAAKTTLGMMLVLMVVTLSAAVGMTALIISRIRRPIDRLNKALDYASQGHLHGRINELRTDEFGALYNKFNTLMDEVEDQLHEQDAKQP